MQLSKRMQALFKEPGRILTGLASRGLMNWLPNRPYLKLVFRHTVGYPLNLEKPTTFNEKMQWLKLNYQTKQQVILADKVAVRSFVEEKIGADHLIPSIGVYDRVEDIPWEKLPNRFVLKCNHASTANIVCTDKSKLDIGDAKRKLRRWMGQSWYWYGREWPYKHIKPRILAEEFIDDGHQTGLVDYKFFCFDGQPRALFVARDRQSQDEETKFDFYDLDWNWLPIINGHPNAKEPMERPAALEEMIRLSKVLSAGFPHVRVDWYCIKDKVLFGEMTFYHFSGFTPFVPSSWDKTFGEWLTLPTEPQLLGPR